MTRVQFLAQEDIFRELQPHPFSFWHLHLVWISLFFWGIVIGWIFTSVSFDKLSDENDIKNGIELIVWLAGLIFLGIITSLLKVRWRILFIYLSIFVFGTWIIWFTNAWAYVETIIPLYTMGVSIIGLFLVEQFRKSHHYILTNMRLIIKGGIIIRRERTLRYDKIADIDYTQGIGGRLFRYGSVIPITQSGFGLGSDTSFAAGGANVSTKKRFSFFGLVGGEKAMQTPRTRTYYQLHGVYPFKEIKKHLETFIQASTIAPYQKEQVSLQREMVDILKQNIGERTSGNQATEAKDFFEHFS